MTLPELVLRRPVAATTCLIAAMVLGVVSLLRLPVAYLPEIEGRSLTIQAAYRSSSPREVERTICRPLEEELASLTGLESLSSTARADGATVRVELASGADVDQAALEVRERIDRARAQLPPDLGRVEVRRWRSSDRPVFRFRLAAEDPAERARLPAYVDEVLTPRLARLPGVSNVDVRGLTRRRVLVELRRERLAQAGLTANEVVDALRTRNRNVSAGDLRSGGRVLSVRVLGELGDAEAVAALPLREHLLSDLAEVREETEPVEQVTHLDGREALTVRVSKESGSNSMEVCRRVRAELEELRASPLSRGIRLEVISDDATRIGERLDNLAQSGLFGGALLVGVLLVFLRRLRPTLIVALTIPGSVVIGFALIFLLRQAGAIETTLNVVSIMGLILGIGLVVDNGIVVLENVVRLRDLGLPAEEAAARGAAEVSAAITASMITSLIVFVPMLLNDDMGGRWTRDLAVMVCVTVFASMWVALTVVPLLAGLALGPAREKPPEGLVSRAYGWLIGRSLRWRWAVVLILFPLCGWQIARFFSTVERAWGMGEVTREVSLSVQVPHAFGAPEREALFGELEGRILAAREALDLQRLTTSFRLRPDASGQGHRRMGPDEGDSVELLLNDGPGDRPSVGEVRERLRALLPERAGVVYSLGASRRAGGRSSAVAVQVQGRASQELREPARQVALALQGVPGVEEVEASDALGSGGIEVRPDRVAGGRFGVTAERVGRTVASSLSERAVTRLRTRHREVDVVVRLRGDQEGVDALKRMAVGRDATPGATGAGAETLRLSSVATLGPVPAPLQIERVDRRAVVTVTAAVEEGASLRTVSGRVEERLRALTLPSGVSVEVARDVRRWRQGEAQNPWMAALALVLVLMVLSSLFESLLDALVIAVTVPLALLGVAWAFWLTGTRLGDMAWVGFMILIGIVVNHGIVFVDRVHQLRREGLDERAALVQAGRDRLRPIVMTAGTTVLGLLPVVGQHLFPLVFRADSGAQVYGPIGLAVASGLTVSTGLSLLVLPAVLAASFDLRRLAARVLR
ncbi:MAG: efflux RND transporter permease subunit [Planctomycetota bacterium]